MSDSGTNDNLIRTYQVRRPDVGTGASCTYKDLATLIDAEFTDAEVGDTVSITVGQMKEEDYDKLPEFMGW